MGPPTNHLPTYLGEGTVIGAGDRTAATDDESVSAPPTVGVVLSSNDSSGAGD